MDIQQLNITEASRLLREKKISAVELVKQCFANIKKYERKIHAFLSLRENDALAEAKEILAEEILGRLG